MSRRRNNAVVVTTALFCLIVQISLIGAVKVKMVVHSEQEDSRMDEEEEQHPTTESEASWAWSHPKKRTTEPTMMLFLKNSKKPKENPIELEEEKATTQKALPVKPMHPNDLLFSLIYKQDHVNSMFKFGENWYTWSIDKQSDGSKVTNYYICYEEPKRCDDIGWEHTDSPPKCAFQIDSLTSDDRACLNAFGVQPHSNGICDGAEQMKVGDIVHSCGPRIRSLWRFMRVGRRPTNVPKPADVNSLICEDEEECYVTVEYRIHHDRITFSLHEPTRGQTFKSALKRDVNVGADETKTTTIAVHSKKALRDQEQQHLKKMRVRTRSKASPSGKGVFKESSDSENNQKLTKNRIRIKEDISEDNSE